MSMVRLMNIPSDCQVQLNWIIKHFRKCLADIIVDTMGMFETRIFEWVGYYRSLI